MGLYGGAVAEKPSIYPLLVEIGAACGEAAGILEGSYLRQAHWRRQCLIEAVGSAAIDGRATTPERLYAWLSDIPIAGQANLGAEAYAARLFAGLSGRDPASALSREAAALAAAAYARAGRDLLAAAAQLFTGRDAVTAASRAGFALYLRQALGPAAPAPSPLLFGLEAAARRPAPVFAAYVAARLATAARTALAHARTLRDGLGRVHSALGAARRSSRVHAIAELLFAGHPLSITAASRSFRISRLAAATHLRRLERDGLAMVAVRRGAGAGSGACDGTLAFHAAPLRRASGRLAVGTSKPLPAELRARLDAIADEVDTHLAALDRLLARLD